jgi:hypothetical protein
VHGGRTDDQTVNLSGQQSWSKKPMSGIREQQPHRALIASIGAANLDRRRL